MKKTKGIMIRKKIAVLVAFAICIGLLSAGRVEAAGKPAKPSVSLVKRNKTTATIKIKKKGSVSGYHIAVAKSKKGKYSIMPTKMRKYKIVKLKANKVYYVKVRAFRTKGYRVQYGKFSKILKIGKYKKPKDTEPTVTPTIMPSPDASMMPDETPLPGESPLPDSSEQPEGSTPEPDVSEQPGV